MLVHPVPVPPSTEALIARLTDTAPVPTLFTICAWHTPKAELLALSRQYPGQISHSMCPACMVKFEAGL